MEKWRMAIVWPANPKEAGPDMPPEEADVEANSRELKKRGAVYWDSFPARKEIDYPINGYIYIAGKGQVKYKCRVEHVINLNRLLKMPGEHKFVPTFRNQCLKGSFEDGKDHEPSQTWIKISQINELKPLLKLGELKKLNGKQVERVQGGFVYIRDPF